MAEPIDLEAALDQLYSLPASEFVAVRNDLAKRLRSAGAGDAAGRVKKLPRPTVTAWAVNQLAFRARSELEGLKAAGEQVRAAHLAGPQEQQTAAKARRDAISTLRVIAEVALQEVGVTPSRIHRQRISQTLEVLSSQGDEAESPRAGRLSTDLEPAGFDALTDLAAALAASQKARPMAAQAKPADRRASDEAKSGSAKQPSTANVAVESATQRRARPKPEAIKLVPPPKVVEHAAARASKNSATLKAAARRHQLDRNRNDTRSRLERLEEKISGLDQRIEVTAAELAKAKRAEATAVEAALKAEQLAREARARVEAAAGVTAKARLDAEAAAAARGRVDAELAKAREQLADVESARARLSGRPIRE